MGARDGVADRQRGDCSRRGHKYRLYRGMGSCFFRESKKMWSSSISSQSPPYFATQPFFETCDQMRAGGNAQVQPVFVKALVQMLTLTRLVQGTVRSETVADRPVRSRISRCRTL